MGKNKRPLSPSHVVSTTQFEFNGVSKGEYESLVQENIQLKHQQATLERILTIQGEGGYGEWRGDPPKNIEIEQLRSENEALRLRISQLEEKVAHQSVKIDEQSARIDEQSAKIDEQALLINSLLHENQRRKQQQWLKMFLIILQDINDFHRIENGSDEPYRTYMKNIHRSRVEMAHFINGNDSDALKEYKCRYVLERKQELKAIEPLLNKRAKFDDFTNKMIAYLEHLPVNYQPTDEEREEVDNWWNDQL